MRNKKPQPFLVTNLKWVSSALLILGLLFVYFIPRAIQYSEYSVIRSIPVAFIFFLIPILLLIALTSITKRFNLSIGIVAVSVLIIGLTFGLFQDYQEKKELNKYGVWTNSVVVNKKRSVHRGGGSVNWMIKCDYKVNGNVYETFYHNDLNNIHSVGDTIRLIYSSQVPQIYALEYEWKK